MIVIQAESGKAGAALIGFAGILFDPPDQPYPSDQMMGILFLKQGDTFRDSALRQTIQALYSTGRFADIALDASEAESPTGVVLKFITAGLLSSNAFICSKLISSGLPSGSSLTRSVPDFTFLFRLILYWNQTRRSGSQCIGNKPLLQAHLVTDKSSV